ncbi:MAG: hypothetical protein JXQ93_12675 [Flavobacteriaceae bacterium]
MKKIFALLFIICTSSMFGQQVITKKYQSEYLNGIRNLRIYIPEGHDTDSISNYPLAIVLDAEKLFDLYVGNAKIYAETDNAPKQIIVGIDMKETRVKDVSFDPLTSAMTKGSNNFYLFIRDELIPYIEGAYKTSPFLTIVGQGTSANFSTYFLREKLQIFNAYICLNGTFSDDINRQIESYKLEKLKKEDNTFYIYIAGNPFKSKKRKVLIDQLGTYLKSFEVPNLNVVYNDFKDSPSATSIMSEAMGRSFAKIFEIYSGISKIEFEEKVKALTPPDAITYLETKYLDIEFLFGSNIGIREQDIFAIEGIIIDQENGDYLDDFGKMILKVYPNSHLGDYYLGLYYETGKNYKRALEMYRKGYSKINPDDPKADLFYQNIERVLGKR